jgi:hypothetical protein
MSSNRQGIYMHFVEIVRKEGHVRSAFDRRVFVTRHVCEYRGEDGEVYRKSFEAKGTPFVPERGFNLFLNEQSKQW